MPRCLRGKSVNLKRHAPMPASYLLTSPRISAYHLQTPRITPHLLASCCTCRPLLVSPLYLTASPPMTWGLRMRSMNLNDMPRCQVLPPLGKYKSCSAPRPKVLLVPPWEKFEPKRHSPEPAAYLLASPRITSHLLVSTRISSYLLELPRISWYPLCSSSLLFLRPGASVGKV